MEPNVFDKVHDVDLKKTMEQSYIDYAMMHRISERFGETLRRVCHLLEGKLQALLVAYVEIAIYIIFIKYTCKISFC